MGLAEGDAGHAAGDEAQVDGVEAAEEGVGPSLGGLGRAGLDDLGGLLEDLVELLLPLLDVALVDGAGASLGLGLGGDLSSGHCDGWM